LNFKKKKKRNNQQKGKKRMSYTKSFLRKLFDIVLLFFTSHEKNQYQPKQKLKKLVSLSKSNSVQQPSNNKNNPNLFMEIYNEWKDEKNEKERKELTASKALQIPESTETVELKATPPQEPNAVHAPLPYAPKTLHPREPKNISVKNKRTISMRLLQKSEKATPTHMFYKAKTFLYAYLAMLFYFQSKYNSKILIVFTPIVVHPTLKSPYDMFIGLGFFYIIKNIHDNHDWMKPIIQKCLKIILKCIEKKKLLVIFPLQYMTSTEWGHQNLCLYRIKDYTIEWYEPHGNKYAGDIHDKNTFVTIKLFLTGLKNELKYYVKHDITLFLPNEEDVQYKPGPQVLEEEYARKVHLDGDGKCILWSLLFIQQIIKSPNVTAKSFMKKIDQSFQGTKDKLKSFFDLSIGFLSEIDIILSKHFHVTLKELNENHSFFDKPIRQLKLEQPHNETEKKIKNFLLVLENLREKFIINPFFHLEFNHQHLSLSSSINFDEQDSASS
jgi:hypothetical protein